MADEKGKNPIKTPIDAALTEAERAKQENKLNRDKQRIEDKIARDTGATGEVEVPVKTVPSSPDPTDPNIAENDYRKNPNHPHWQK